MKDQFFTPNWLSKRVAEVLPTDFAGTVMDPTVGDGALLRAIFETHPSTKEFLASDIDMRVFGPLKKSYPGWLFGKVDVFNARSRRSSKVWRAATQAGVDVVVCNPPYSYRGRSGRITGYEGIAGVASPAASVCASILSEIKPRHALVALLPSSTFQSELDSWLWAEIRTSWNVELLERLDRNTFPGVRAETILVRISRRLFATPETLPMSSRHVPSVCMCVSTVRGSLPMHLAGKYSSSFGTPLIHTTNLSSGVVIDSSILVMHNNLLSGNAILLPRVGAFRKDKICLYSGDSDVVLSDCVIAIQSLSDDLTARLYRELVELAPEISELYQGTGAHYTTLRRIKEFLMGAGFTVIASGTTDCECGLDAAFPGLPVSA